MTRRTHHDACPFVHTIIPTCAFCAAHGDAFNEGMEWGQRDERARIRAGVTVDLINRALDAYDDEFFSRSCPHPDGTDSICYECNKERVVAEIHAVIDPDGGGKGVPRVLTADDPEPALRSIVTDLIGDAWQSYISEGGSIVWASIGQEEFLWTELLTLGPITLIHDAGGE